MSEHEHEEQGTGGAIATRPKGEQRLEAKLAEGNKVLAPADWQMLSAIAETVNNTEFVPSDLRGNAPKVLACMLYGHALGISPMIALKEISVIDGTPSMSSALMVAKVIDAGHDIERMEIRDAEGVMTGTTAHGTRGDTGKQDSFTFTIDMARRAGLMSKKNWQNYPEAMLWWRASSQLCSFLFPDVFMGSPYMPEELGADAVEMVPVGGAVSPAAAGEPETGPGQGERLEPSEAPAGPAAPAKTAQEVAAELAAKLEGRAGPNVAEAGAQAERGLEGAEPLTADVLIGEAEDFWTPLDDRDPTEAEYAFAQLVVGNPDSSEEDMAAAQVLIESYEEKHPTEMAGELSPPSVVGKGTAAELLLQVAEAQERGDVEWLEAMLAQEESASRPRIRLVAGLKEAIAKAKGEPAPAPTDDEHTPFAPAADDQLEPPDEETSAQPEPDDTAAAQLESNETGHRFDPNVPLEELDHTQLVVRARAITAYMGEQHPEVKEWQYQAVVTAAGNQWKLPIEKLDDLEAWQLRFIVQAAPEQAIKVLEVLTGEQVEKLAATAPGSNPA